MTALNQTSNQFRVFFLMQFSKEVLRNSTSYDLEALQKILKKKTQEKILGREREIKNNKKQIEELIKKRKQLNQEQIQITSGKVKTKVVESETLRKPQIISPIALPRNTNVNYRYQERIPQVQIPYSPYQGVLPSPSNEKIDLGDLNIYLDDPSISSVECNGPETLLIIRRGRELRRSDIVLTNDQIQEILRAFSRAAKIPINEGVFRVAIGRVILTAQVSGELGTKFILSKMY